MDGFQPNLQKHRRSSNTPTTWRNPCMPARSFATVPRRDARSGKRASTGASPSDGLNREEGRAGILHVGLEDAHPFVRSSLSNFRCRLGEPRVRRVWNLPAQQPSLAFARASQLSRERKHPQGELVSQTWHNRVEGERSDVVGMGGQRD